jgi:2-oxoisovalerate dehydrogenase E1 component alpha subunit
VPHSSDDDDKRYRTAEAVEEASKKEPITRFAEQLRKLGALDDARGEEIAARVKSGVDDATDWAEAQPNPAPEEALRHVYVEES